MAIKNWKKVGIDSWKNTKTGAEIDVEFGDVGRGKRWFVFLNLKQISKNDGLTKAQALKLARSYRRSH